MDSNWFLKWRVKLKQMERCNQYKWAFSHAKQPSPSLHFCDLCTGKPTSYSIEYAQYALKFRAQNLRWNLSSRHWRYWELVELKSKSFDAIFRGFEFNFSSQNFTFTENWRQHFESVFWKMCKCLLSIVLMQSF